MCDVEVHDVDCGRWKKYVKANKVAKGDAKICFEGRDIRDIRNIHEWLNKQVELSVARDDAPVAVEHEVRVIQIVARIFPIIARHFLDHIYQNVNTRVGSRE